jgi:hypothetical protein
MDNDEYINERNDEVTSEICSECKGRLIKEPVADGADDYKFTYTCERCGETYSN